MLQSQKTKQKEKIIREKAIAEINAEIEYHKIQINKLKTRKEIIKTSILYA